MRDILPWFRSAGRFLIKFLALCLFVSIIAITISSLFFAQDQSGQVSFRFIASFDEFIKSAGDLSIPIALATFLASLVSILFYHVFGEQYELRNIENVSSHHIRKRTFWIASGLALATTVLAIFFTSELEQTNIALLVFNNPGGLFAIITGVFSVVALYLTLAAVLEIRHSITSFADYIYKFERLINETAPDDFVNICVHTPATGCLALPHHIWQRIHARLGERNVNYALVCLGQDEMRNWFEKFLLDVQGNPSRVQEMKERMETGLEYSQDIKNDAMRAPNMRDINANAEHKIPKLIETSWDRLPSVYFIANRNRAIVAAPFFLPKRNQISSIGTFNERVEIIGFETGDVGVVSSVHKEIARIREHVAQLNEHDKILSKTTHAET